MQTHKLRNVLGRLAGVDLGGRDDEDGGAPLNLRELNAEESPSGTTPTSSSPSLGDDPSNISSTYATHPDRKLTSSIGLVTIGAEISDDTLSSDGAPGTPTELRSVRQLVISDVSTRLDIKFSPALRPPQYGLVIKDIGVETGGGFVGVTFVNCRFDEAAPTIFQNCWFSGVTFTECDFRSALLENVVMVGNKFLYCIFDHCCWKNRKLSEQYVFRQDRFTDEQISDVEPKEIVAQNLAREVAARALLDAPPPPTKKHESGYSVPKGWNSLEDEYERHNKIQPVEFSSEAFSIPLEVGAGISFDNTPRAGLTVALGPGCHFEEVQFTNSSFKRTTLRNCHFVNVTFEDCVFENVSFTEVVIMNRRYKNVWFHGCAWSRRVLTKPAVLQNETYRQGCENPTEFPAILSEHAAVQEKQRIRQESRALIQRPLSKYQQKRERLDFSVKTTLEVEREKLGPGDTLVTYVPPGAVYGVRSKDVGTTFVTPSFD